MFYRTRVTAEVLHRRNIHFQPFLLLWPWPWSDDLQIRTWPVFPDVWKWISYVKSFETHHITAWECIHLVKCDHFQSRDKDGSHTIWSIVAENPMIHTKTSWLYLLYDRSYVRSKFYISSVRIFNFFCSCDSDLDPMTFIYELDPYSLEIHQMCEYELPIWRLSKVIVWQAYIQTDRHDRNYIWRRFAFRKWSTMKTEMN